MDDRAAGDGRRCDVVVVGGGAAGLAAALQLGRSRRSVVVVDAGEPRNAPAAHMHGYLGHDGRAPSELLALGRTEVGRYGVDVVDGRVTEVTAEDEGFRVALADGTTLVGRRVLVATGLTDVLPDIPGVAEQWGRGVIHCPYCHGWEVQDLPLVVIATGPPGAHQAALFRQLSDRVTLVVHEGPGPDQHVRRRLLARGVRIVDERVDEVVRAGDRVTGVRLAGGAVLDADAVVVGPRFVSRAGPLAPLGIAAVPDPSGMGDVIETDALGATAVPGVYAAGNAADLRAQVLQAASEGSRVAAQINADLVAEDAEAAARPPTTPEEWDARYAGQDQVWSGRANGVLVTELAGREPGRALDVGCGEGADAIWLAQKGWRVTAVDVSQVALDRARAAAEAAGLEVEWVRVDVGADPMPDGPYDLVSVHYPALARTPDGRAISALLAAVAPGGTLLVVGHADIEEHARAHGLDPDDFVQPADVAARLDGSWEVTVDETRPRTAPPPPGTAHVHDRVLRARRRTSSP
jgi:thioredoxin reductase/SAM-dependent methyltransferase